MGLLERTRALIHKQFKSLNAKGLNFAGRHPVSLVVYEKGALGPDPMIPASNWAPVENSALPLVPVEFKVGDVARWDKELSEMKVIGEARLEVTAFANDEAQTELTRDLLLGLGEDMKHKRVYYVIGESEVLYSPVPGQCRDIDGSTWEIVLERRP